MGRQGETIDRLLKRFDEEAIVETHDNDDAIIFLQPKNWDLFSPTVMDRLLGVHFDVVSHV